MSGNAVATSNQFRVSAKIPKLMTASMPQRAWPSWAPRAEVMIVPLSGMPPGSPAQNVKPRWPLARRTAVQATNRRSIDPCAPLVSSVNDQGGFVGRRGELRILEERLAAAQMGRPQVVYLEGEAGAGKSTLLSRFLGSLSDAAVLEVGGDEAEKLLSYGVVDQLQPGAITDPGRAPRVAGAGW